MSSSRVRLQIGVLLFVLLPAATGVIAVHASATCERFVRTYVTKPVRNRVSKATAKAWAEWRVAHPNWKPNPAVHRPKYLMTRDEAVNKVAFACTVPEIPTDTELLFKTADLEGPPPMVDLPPMDSTQISFPDEIPPEVAEVTPESWPPLATFIPPALGGTAEHAAVARESAATAGGRRSPGADKPVAGCIRGLRTLAAAGCAASARGGVGWRSFCAGPRNSRPRWAGSEPPLVPEIRPSRYTGTSHRWR